MVRDLRRVDAATVAAYYGSDSAGTFLTCVGALQAARIAFAPFIPVLLAIMEIPGCLVGLYLVAKLRKSGMDRNGYMPTEEGFGQAPKPVPVALIQDEKQMALEAVDGPVFDEETHANRYWQSIIREVFLNPGLFLLFSGILIGFISRLQGPKVVEGDDKLFVSLFQGLLCLFLLEMGMTAAKRLKDLKTASWRFVAFGIIAPNFFAAIGILVCHTFSLVLMHPFQLGTYVLFAVLCAAASYIAVPAIQRLAIPEASPTLPLAPSLGLTFVYNVTIGIPLYTFLAQQLLIAAPVCRL